MWFVALVTLAFVVALAMGPMGPEGPGGGQGRRPGNVNLVMLLQNEDVQDELKLTDEQIAETKKIVMEVRTRFRSTLQQAQSLPQPQAREKLPEISRTITQEMFQSLGSLLSEQQVKRLKQILIQAQGFIALMDAEVRKTLKLTDADVERYKTLAQEAQRELQDKIQKARQNGRADMISQIPEWRRQAVDKAISQLGPEIHKLWKGMIGDPFDMPLRSQGPGGGNGRPRGMGGPMGGPPGGGGRQFNLDFDEG